MYKHEGMANVISAAHWINCMFGTTTKPVVDPAKYQVQTAQELQQRFDALNVQLAQDFQKFKKVESIAFAHQFPFRCQ